ncbi:hypothetical protein RM844_28725 [Streptomyces sp. DSM 44915]|uniref:Uncharacterized protein n=1 Tax=Streptomyces chisholmiae TaxID=3075540 RepID=A0ABU2JZJ4_9ACTN|nr:hypothetical protein [Streptomyces sp. DSM 44915]MDT0270262.1 hypothetical protein [Streptomyces sp. DSM 44915]
MATTQLTYTDLLPNGGVAQPAGTTLVAAPTDNMQLANSRPELTVLRVTNTGGSALTLTVKAGTYPPAIAAGQGDLEVTVAATSGVQLVGPFESGRFVQGDGSMLIESSATTGTIAALLIPRNT